MSLIKRQEGWAARGVAGDPTWPERCEEILRRRAAGESLKAIGESMGLGKERVRQIEFLCGRRSISSADILAHIEWANPHAPGSPRDAWGGNDVNNIRRRKWYGPFDIDPSEFCPMNLWAASKRDVKRYAKLWEKGSVPPAVVAYHGSSGKLIAVDGAHRVEAAALLGLRVPTYIGILEDASRTRGQRAKMSRAEAFQKLGDIPASALKECDDCEWQDEGGVWRTGVCDYCKRDTQQGFNEPDDYYANRMAGEDCENCQGTGSPICCRCEGTHVDPYLT